MSYINKIGFRELPPVKLVCYFTEYQVGILPLGTGNDLARTLGWGSGYNDEPLDLTLIAMEQARETLFDMWSIDVTAVGEAKDEEDGKKVISNHSFVMNNYVSFGAYLTLLNLFFRG